MDARKIAWVLPLAVATACGSSAKGDLFGSQGSAGDSSGGGSGAGAGGSGGSGAGGETVATGTGGSLPGSGGVNGSGGFVPAESGGSTTGIDAGRPDTGASRVCPVRGFSGTVTGSNYASQIGNISTSATVVFTVVASGAIDGTYTGTAPIASTAKVSGSMDCRTSAVTIAIEGGSYKGVFPFTSAGTFSGTMTGSYAANAQFSGTWTITENNPSYGGTGTWNAN